MTVLLGLFLVLVIMLALLFGLSIGIAFLLAWLLPNVGLEMALLVAVIGVGQAILIVGRMLSTLPASPDADMEREPPIVILDREIALPRRRRGRT